MCGVCGCADPMNDVTVIDPDTGAKSVLRQGGILGDGHGHDHGHDHSHNHEQSHAHDHAHDHHHHPHDGEDEPHVHGPNGEVIKLETAILAKNDGIAARNRGWFEGRGVLALNFVSSPGAGKTSLLERTIRDMGDKADIAVVEGDQMTANDANRIREAGARAIQINTGAGCHLEADMVAEAVKQLDPRPGSILMIENVGNLVCPAMFDLGEHMKIAVISTTEGEDKPLKYPHMFRACELVLINKMDLAPHVDFNEAECRANIAAVNPSAQIMSVSAKSGAGFEGWMAWLMDARQG